MPRPEKLTGADRENALKAVPEWTSATSKDGIERKFSFKDFKEAWDFMGKIAKVADEMDHHPEWFNVYNRVEILLSTHDCGGLSQLDIDLAKQIDEFYKH